MGQGRTANSKILEVELPPPWVPMVILKVKRWQAKTNVAALELFFKYFYALLERSAETESTKWRQSPVFYSLESRPSLGLRLYEMGLKTKETLYHQQIRSREQPVIVLDYVNVLARPRVYVQHVKLS